MSALTRGVPLFGPAHIYPNWSRFLILKTSLIIAVEVNDTVNLKEKNACSSSSLLMWLMHNSGVCIMTDHPSLSPLSLMYVVFLWKQIVSRFYLPPLLLLSIILFLPPTPSLALSNVSEQKAGHGLLVAFSAVRRNTHSHMHTHTHFSHTSEPCGQMS